MKKYKTIFKDIFLCVKLNKKIFSEGKNIYFSFSCMFETDFLGEMFLFFMQNMFFLEIVWQWIFFFICESQWKKYFQGNFFFFFSCDWVKKNLENFFLFFKKLSMWHSLRLCWAHQCSNLNTFLAKRHFSPDQFHTWKKKFSWKSFYFHSGSHNFSSPDFFMFSHFHRWKHKLKELCHSEDYSGKTFFSPPALKY